MADNPPDSKSGSLPPPRPTTGKVALPKTQTTRMPGVPPGKIIVTLSSVAKAAPARTQPLTPATPVSAATPPPLTPKVSAPPAKPPPRPTVTTDGPPKVEPISARLKSPPPLPPKQVSPIPPMTKTTPSTRMSSTTFVKLPPKTANPSLVTLTGKPATPAPVTTPSPAPVEKAKDAPTSKTVPVSAPSLIPSTPPPIPPQPAKILSVSKSSPPPLPAKKISQQLSRKTGAHKIPVIKVDEETLSGTSAADKDSIFAPADTSTPLKPSDWKKLEPGELPQPAGGLKGLEVFERSQKILDKAPTPTVGPSITTPATPPVPVTPANSPSAPTFTGPMVKPAPTPLPETKAKTPPPIETKATPPVAPVKEPAPVEKAKTTPPPLAAPPLRPPARVETEKTALNKPPVTPPPVKEPEHPVHHAPPMLEKAPEPVAEKLRQPHLPPETPKSAAPAAKEPDATLHVAPPMLEKAPEPIAEKLPQPHLSGEPPKSATPPPVSSTPAPAVTKAPALVNPDAAKPPTSLAKSAGDWLKKTAPIMLPKAPEPVAEVKPTLKPPVLPKRTTMLKEAGAEKPAVTTAPEALIVTAKDAAKKTDSPAATTKLPDATKTPEKVDTTEKAKATGPIPVVVSPANKATTKIADKVPEKETKPDDKTADKDKAVTTPAKTDSTISPVVAAAAAGALAATTAASPLKGTSPLISKLPEKGKETQPLEAKKSAPPKASKPAPLPKTRAERAKRRRLVETLIFWCAVLPLAMAGLVLGSLYFGRETRVEGQVIPPKGMSLNNEVWIVTDFSSYASGIAEDLAGERTPLMQEIQERREHVQRVQADVASREERIRLINEQISGAKAEIAGVVKKSRDETQAVWDGEGASIDDEYQSKMSALKQAIADRAKSLGLKYEPADTFQSPEVWANAYRLSLYEVPKGVDSNKEYQWLGEQMKTWRALQKSLDARKEALREKAAEIKTHPGPKIADLSAKIEDLQARIDTTTNEEVPLKAEMQQAQADLAQAQAADANLDDKYYKQLYSLPGGSITKHITLAPNGRFTWIDDNNFLEGEKEHRYLIFSRATRSDGRQYWSLHRFAIAKNQLVELIFEPGGFQSTKAILRPNLSPEEQEE